VFKFSEAPRLQADVASATHATGRIQDVIQGAFVRDVMGFPLLLQRQWSTPRAPVGR
jgi:hypothetical protein